MTDITPRKISLLAITVLSTIALASGCAENTADAALNPRCGTVLTIALLPPAPDELAALQQAVADGRLSWPADPAQVLANDLQFIVNHHPADQSADAAGPATQLALQAINDDQLSAATGSYNQFQDPCGMTRLIFTLPSYLVEGTLESMRPRDDLPPEIGRAHV